MLEHLLTYFFCSRLIVYQKSNTTALIPKELN